MPLTIEQREDLVNRLIGGQTPAGIATAMHIGIRTVYRLKKKFLQPDGSYIVTAPKRVPKESITREQLLVISEIVTDNPKIRLHELKSKAIAEGIFEADQYPDTSTVYRRLRALGFHWGQARFDHPRASEAWFNSNAAASNRLNNEA
jgi:transposase